MSFEVRIEAHNFARYQSWNVYPANVWVDYLDAQGQPASFRRSFDLDVEPGHQPAPSPLLSPELAGQRLSVIASTNPGCRYRLEFKQALSEVFWRLILDSVVRPSPFVILYFPDGLDPPFNLKPYKTS